MIGLSLLPALGILSCLYFRLGLPTSAWVRFALWLLVGLAVYYAYGFAHSRLQEATGA